MAGIVFAELTNSDALKHDFEQLAQAFGVAQEEREALRQVAQNPCGTPLPGVLGSKDALTQAYVQLGRAIAPSPAEVSPELVDELRTAGAQPQGVVELVNFMALSQLLLRLDAFYPANR